MVLSKGLYIENHNFMIPWGIMEEQAWSLGNPIPTNLPEDRSRITWKNVVCLNGFKCDVCIWFEKARLYSFSLVHPNFTANDGQIMEMVIHADKIFGKRDSDKYFWKLNNIEISLHADTRFVTAYWYELINPLYRE